MLHHRALGRDLDKLVVTVVDNRQPMLSIMRAMLAAIGVARIETYENPVEALAAMCANAPDVVLAGEAMRPLGGTDLIRSMRQADAGRLCFVPAMIMSAHAKPDLVAEALKAGAHQVLVLPTSAGTLYRRLDWLVNDDRPFELRNAHYVVSGLEERLALVVPRPSCEPGAARVPVMAAHADKRQAS